MKKRVEELLRGEFSCEAPRPVASVTEVQVEIPENGKYKGSFSVGAEDGSRIKGIVSTDNHRILTAKESICGNTCSLVFGIDTEGLKAGERVEGRILLSTNLGELEVPVQALILESKVESRQGQIQTLEDFTKLCMRNMREGFRLFTGDSFVRLLKGKNRSLLPLYRGMSHNPVTYQHMEEFLVAAGRKEAISLSLDKRQKAVYRLDSSQKDTLYIYKNTWGYVRMEIEVEGDFLQVEKKVVTSDDFIGRIYGLEYVVDRDRLGRGRHYGRIRIHNVYQVLDFWVEASPEGDMRVLSETIGRKKILWLLRDYLNLGLKKLEVSAWRERSAQLVGELREEDPQRGLLILWEAFLAYDQGQTARALELLWPIRDGLIPLETPLEHALYLSLAKATGLLPEEDREIAPLLKKYYRQAPDSYPLLEFWLREDPFYDNMPSRVLYEMEACYQMGCISPFLYLHAWRLLEQQETLLRRLTPFLLQVLRFAQKQGILTEEILLRAAFLSGHQKDFYEPLYQLMAAGYDRYPQKEVLEAICKLLMKGKPGRKEYFRWYALAVDQDLRITRLYEYYMETLQGNGQQELPKAVLMYFTYKNQALGEKKKALLYASIILHKSQDPDTYAKYRRVMDHFAREALKKGRINEDYGVLYQEFLLKPEDRAMAEDLARVLFTHKLTCQDRKIRQVVVCHKALAQEQVYRCNEGIAYISLYSEDACILFEDEKKRRFATTVEYKLDKLMEEKEGARCCMEEGARDTGLELYCCRERAWQMEINGRNLACYRMAADNPEFSSSYRYQVRKKLLDYYMQHQEDPRLAGYLRQMEPLAYARVDKVSMVTLLTGQGMYEEAFAVTSRLGYEGMEEELLLRLASRMILKREWAEEEELLCLAAHVFRGGKYDEILLCYLRDYAMGSVEDLVCLWMALKNFQLDTYRLEERILLLSMYVRRIPDHSEQILQSYLLQQGKEGVIVAFLTYLSFCFFLQGQELPEGIFTCLSLLYDRKWKMDLVCSLSLLKHYAQKGDLTSHQEDQVRSLLDTCLNQGLRFEFYQHLPSQLIQACQVEDKVFVEEHFPQGSRVLIHYRLQREGGEETEWISQPMKEMYRGIFSREFLLFYDERLVYYLTLDQDGEQKKTEVYQLSLMDLDTSGRSRYKLLNKILASRKLGNREGTQEALRRYLWQDAFANQIFTLL